MKVHATITSFLISSASINVDAQITTYPCPAAGTSSILPISNTNTSSSSSISLPIITNPNGLCILLRHSKVDGSKRVHLVRSYAGNGWELSSGSFTKRDSGVTVDCNVGDVYECEVTLPPLAMDGNEEYVLESYEYEISPEAEASRFLEQVRLYIFFTWLLYTCVVMFLYYIYILLQLISNFILSLFHIICLQ